MKSKLLIRNLLIDEYNPYGLFYEREVIDQDVALFTIMELLGSGHIEDISVRNTHISHATFFKIKGYELFYGKFVLFSEP
jgi:hypothetical protein